MIPLFTWRDVERCLSREESPPWLDVSADLETLTIVCAAERRQEVLDRLAKVFGPRLSKDGAALELEATREAPRLLTVVLEAAEQNGGSRPRVIRPLWPDASSVPRSVEPFPPGSPKIAAFYSYKGGVGRTTTLLATLGALLEMRPSSAPVRVLVIDADLEAPGLTFDIPGPTDRFCLLDFLALVHDADDWRTSAVPLAAERLRQSSEMLELRSGRTSFYFLPAFLDANQIFAPSITMEQVVRARGRAHVIAEAFAALGQAIGADVVLVDLRAGVTEISSPLLLDPRVQTILVTSCNGQSITGTKLVLGRMEARIKRETSPEIVLTMIPTDLKAETVAELAGTLKESIPSAADNDVAEDVAQPNIHEVRFAQELVHVDSVRELIVDLLPNTNLGKRAHRLAELLGPRAPEETRAVNSAIPPGAPAGLKAFAEEAKKLEYAEGNAKLGLLVTPALTALVEKFPRDLPAVPAVVVLGAKGAGKTFAWGQMVLAGDWQTFADLVARPDGLAPSPKSKVHIFPLLKPQNMGPELAEQVRGAEDAIWLALGVRKEDDRARLSAEDLLKDLDRKVHESGEADFWAERIAARLGLRESAGVSVEALASALAERSVSICFAVDGLEDYFQPSPQVPLSSLKQELLRGLLQRFTIKVRDLRSPHLGIVTFVRRDLAQAAIVQNFGQFEALYERFSIAWTPAEALRLVAWLLDRSGLAPIASERIPLASYDELRDALKAFWGERLGSKGSNEAHTDRWVIAALSDFQGRLQARDLVRLVRYAAEAVPTGPVLTPKALREALVQCSTEKIKELATEIPGLSQLFDRFRSASEEQKKIPFHGEDFNLSPEEISFLESQGIVIRIEQGELYLPEIVRHGLGFRLDKGRRAKVLALYRAAQAKRV
jgi:cellulose biosynthesis protein BcsQ